MELVVAPLDKLVKTLPLEIVARVMAGAGLLLSIVELGANLVSVLVPLRL